MTTSTKKSGKHTFNLKMGFGIGAIGLLTTILLQNGQAVDMEILFWEVHTPLVLLLLITSFLTAMVIFSIILIAGKD